ncbi:MAG: phenylalanine--tRNA ligase subunit beta [archaeon]|nr:phenylalanine--tRNA ligase subunit beta [archaeon]MDD2477874.1 phenylalanine--tRNA ligase subunit beta [Candidatus ainarchaeum sp.]MDD3084431.1 phenylalanine--tRNA ligase subunit beta [Candidatus ainarchaeum sp.]MDD4220893.1 phenylalanine--tRNA ligase subunit beta [Candidatus ainarchaeum sp.]MDD4662694.1 phenylalanine--tRNA ligase subunit beta [Candidatus ainarchaeum sp.]
MATIEISFEKLKQELKNPALSIEDLESILFEFGLEIDGYVEAEDLLKIEVTAERVDLLSFYGLSRALKAYLDVEKYRPIEVMESDLQVNVSQSVVDYGAYTMSAVVKDLNLDDQKIKEIINIQEKLHVTYGRKRKSIAIGVYPLDKIKFPISFDAKAPKDIKFVPLGETQEMTGLEILEKHPTGVAYSKLVGGKKKLLVFIDSNNKILSMPPIINSLDTGKVTENTKEIFIECTGQNLSKLSYTINILVEMFKDIGGKVYSLQVNYPNLKIVSPNPKKPTMQVSIDYLNQVLGTDIDINLASELLERMMYVSKVIDNNKLELIVPKFRTDVLHDNDVADDLARAYGFSNIIPKESRVVSVAEKLEVSIKQEQINNIMCNMGFVEIMPLTLSSTKNSFDDFLIAGKDYVKLGFSAESSLNIVSNWLLPKLLKTLTFNQHRSYPQKIFACDFVVVEDLTKDVKSKNVLKTSCVIADSKITFTEISSVLLRLVNVLGYELKLEKKDYNYYMAGRSATVLVDDKVVGTIGELNPKVLINYNYTVPVCGFEIEI